MNFLENLNYMDKYNAVVGAIVAFLSFIFGEHWILFAIFLLFNVIDYMTGWMKSKMSNRINSVVGLKGLLKKFGYWIIILISFLASVLFIEIGNTLGIDLEITTLLGWFVLASLAINELRSIVENLVEAGYNIPMIFTKGLEVADKMINKEEK
ncbi:phage holin family protein [Thomasclavelia saccharogumia]|uniref:phage holin family protein n=1 Tax=Thomasclavelia saccharogumia TaxID=341225 RepID=UPI0004794CD7|nr:phage holin family protein [Thomasclavelia saccharogumia]